MKNNSVGFIPQLLKDFGVRSENELSDKLSKDANTIPCIICHQEKLIEELNFSSGNPVCKSHLRH